MAHHFEAVFAPTKRSFADVLDNLDEIFRQHSIVFSNEIYRLLDQDGRPGIESASPELVTGIAEVAAKAARWAGVSLCCISRKLWDALGPGDATEVFFRILRAKEGGVQVIYNEHRAARHARVEDEELRSALRGMLLQLCASVGSSICIYDEEALLVPIDASMRAVEDILTNRRFPSGGGDGILVFPATAVDMSKIRSMFASGEQIFEATSGLVALDFLHSNL